MNTGNTVFMLNMRKLYGLTSRYDGFWWVWSPVEPSYVTHLPPSQVKEWMIYGE
jgi:hypothetical protein